MVKSKYFRLANASNDDNISRMLVEAELVKQLLIACTVRPGASIDIIVQHDTGHLVSAHLYDHAALVQSLIDALEYFQSEL